MSVSTELARIIQAKEDIISSLEAKGATVPQDALIDDLPDIIDDLPSGGGGNELLKSIDVDEFTGTTFNDARTYITDVTFPNGVLYINTSAFSHCTGLTSITIPDSVTSIGQYAFQYCSGLTSVTIGNSVTSIGNYVFSGCTGLTSVTIGNSVTSIGNNAFSGCTGLTSITIPNSVTSIGGSAFSGCSNLTNINIPDSVTNIGNQAFQNCSSLPVENYVMYADKCAVGLTDTSQSTYVLKNDTKQIGNNLFSGRTAMTSITIPDSVITIMQYTFNNCSNLATVTMGNSVTTLGYGVFNGCSSLTSITIPDSVTSIGERVFFNCTSLSSVTILASTPPTLGNYAFYNNAPGRKIYVPAESVETYKTATYWSSYAADIEAIPSA